MNRKQFVLVLLALVIVGAACLVSLNRNKKAWAVRESRMGDKMLPNFRLNDVAAIHIRGASELNIVHKDGLWRVHERADYPANYQLVRDFLMKVADAKVVQSEMIGPSQHAKVELDEPGRGAGGTLLEFMDAQGKVMNTLLVGKRHPRQRNESAAIDLGALFDGRYILLPGDPNNVLLVSDELAAAAPDPSLWLSRDFFKIENIQDISMVSTNAAGSWELLRENPPWPWTLVSAQPGEVLNTNFAAQLAEMLGFLTYVDVAPGYSATRLENPVVMTILTFDHFAYTLKIGAKQPDGNYPMTASVSANIPAKRVPGNDEPPDDAKLLDEKFQDRTKKLREKLAKEQAMASWVYMIDSAVVESALRDRTQLLEKKPVADAATTATR
jgi:hypothetical protein